MDGMVKGPLRGPFFVMVKMTGIMNRKFGMSPMPGWHGGDVDALAQPLRYP